MFKFADRLIVSFGFNVLLGRKNIFGEDALYDIKFGNQLIAFIWVASIT